MRIQCYNYVYGAFKAYKVEPPQYSPVVPWETIGGAIKAFGGKPENIGKLEEIERFYGGIMAPFIEAVRARAEELRGSEEEAAKVAEHFEAFDRESREACRARFGVHSAGAYIARKFEPQRWIVPGVIPAYTPEVGGKENGRGMACDCIARSKVGKTWLAIRLALCAACGRNIDGTESGIRTRALYVNMELSPNVMRYRLAQVAAQLGIPLTDAGLSNLDVIDNPSPQNDLRPTGDGVADPFAELCKGYGLVVIDPIYKCILPDEDENMARDMAKVVAWRDSLRALGCTVLVVHHEAKRGANGGERDITDAGSGSGVLGRDYDARVVMDTNKDGSRLRKIRYSLRCGVARETDYCVMDEKGGIVFPAEDARAVWEDAYDKGAARKPNGTSPQIVGSASAGSRTATNLGIEHITDRRRA